MVEYVLGYLIFMDAASEGGRGMPPPPASVLTRAGKSPNWFYALGLSAQQRNQFLNLKE
jgi:hypothetical protein